MTNKQKGDLYEKFINSYLNNKKGYESWLWNDIPEYYLRKSGLLGDWNEHRYNRKFNKINELPDTGVDILLKKDIEEKDKYILVQCKNYSSNKSITFECLAGFFGMTKFYDLDGVVFHTTKLSINIKLQKIEGSGIQFIKKDLKKEEDFIKNELNIRLIDQPYYYQIEAYELLKNNLRSILSLQCGMGKTLTSIMIAKDYDNIIIISPLIAYSKQNLDRYDNELQSVEYKSLLINSEGTRDEDEIIKFIKKNKKYILSFTYDSVDVLLKIIIHLYNFIIIIDEFHNLSKNDIIESNEKTPIYDILHSEYRILFMSATPKFFQFESSEEINNKIFGTVNYTFSMGNAITEKHVCDYEIYLPDLRTETTLTEISEEVSIETFDKDLTIKGKFLLRGMLETGARRCIVYLRNQEEAIQMMEILNKLNEYYATDLFTGLIISDTNYLDRTKIIDLFSNFNGLSIICSVKILNECIDIPKCDSIFMTYKTESKILIIQRLCRANRKDINNKNKLSKIFLWCNEYNDIGYFIHQLKDFDETFIENKVLIMNSNENNGGIIERKSKDSEKLYEELDNIIVSIKKFGYGIDSWKKNFKRLKDYLFHNSKPLAKSKDENEKSNGKWLENQMYDYKHNRNIMKLSEIRDIWQSFMVEYKELFNDSISIWTNHLSTLELFINTYQKLPSQSSKKIESSDDDSEEENEENENEMNEFKLAKWIVRNNEQFNNKTKCMTNEDIRNFWTEFKNKYSNLFYAKTDEWLSKMNKVIEFIKKNNRLPVETKEKVDEYNLRIWFKTQQKIYDRDKFNNDNNKRILIEQIYSDYSELFNNETNLELWINKYEQFIDYIKTNKKLPSEKVSTSKINDKDYSMLKSIGCWKSNANQNAKVNFSTVIIDIDPSKLTKIEKDKYEIRLKKYQDELAKDNLILSKTYSKLTPKEKKEFDKIKLKRESINKRFDEERKEAEIKNNLWNQAKIQFNSLF